MCFNQFLGLVICLGCKAAIGSRHVQNHIHDVHVDANIWIDHTMLNEALSDLHTNTSFDIGTLSLHCPQIEGLYLTHDAYLCSHCQHIQGTLLSIIFQHIQHHQCPFHGQELQLSSSITKIALHISKSIWPVSHPRMKMPPLTSFIPSTRINKRQSVISIYPKLIHIRSQHGSKQPNGTSLLPLMIISNLYHWLQCQPQKSQNLRYWPRHKPFMHHMDSKNAVCILSRTCQASCIPSAPIRIPHNKSSQGSHCWSTSSIELSDL